MKSAEGYLWLADGKQIKGWWNVKKGSNQALFFNDKHQEELALLNFRIEDGKECTRVYFSQLRAKLPIEKWTFFTPCCFDEAYIPSGQAQGYLVHHSRATIIDCYGVKGLSMPWVAGKLKDSSWLLYLETPWDGGVYLEGNKVWPLWRFSLGEIGYERSIACYSFTGNYIAACKLYRRIAEEKGLAVTLSEKIKQNLNTERLCGARYVKLWIKEHHSDSFKKQVRYSSLHPLDILPPDTNQKIYHTFRDAENMKIYLKKCDIRNALLILCGWEKGGYDYGRPENWPPASEAGSVQEFFKFLAPNCYLTGLHDNYFDMYETAAAYPEGAVKKKDGTLISNGVWAGGEAKVLCCGARRFWFERNRKYFESNTPAVMFLDVLAAVPLLECYEKKHPMTRREDQESRAELLRQLYEEKIIVGTEGAGDWAVPYLHFFEGGFTNEPMQDGNIQIPLFNLVYHDCVLCLRHQGHTNTYATDWRTKALFDLMNGVPSTFRFMNNRKDLDKAFKGSLCVDRIAARTFSRKMILHRFLDGYTVQESEFDNGLRVRIDINSHTAEVFEREQLVEALKIRE